MQNFAFILEAQPNPLASAIPMLAMVVLLIGMFIWSSRSNKKREKEAADMRDNLMVGDEVTTIGGIIGKVVSIKGETFVLETTKDKTKIRFLRGAIRSVDVKAADIAAAVIESKDAEATEAEAKDANETAEAVETVETVETAAEADAATEEKKDEN